MEHIFGPESHVSIATLVRFFLALTMEIWDRKFGPFRPTFTFFAIWGEVGKTISASGKEPTQTKVVILVAYDYGSIALEFRICSSVLSRVMQLMVRVTLPNFAFLAVFCPVTRPSPRGTASNQRDSKPNPKARDQCGYHGP